MLTPKQQRFVDEYLVDLNATQAAIRAGYSAKTAEVQGPRLLGNVRIAAAIRKRQEKRQERTEITQDFVLNGLRLNAEMALGLKPAPSGVCEWEPAAANRAYELLGKHLGMFVDRIQHEGNERKPIRFIEVLGSEPAEPNAGE